MSEVSWRFGILTVRRNVPTVQNVSPAEIKDHANCYCGLVLLFQSGGQEIRRRLVGV